MQKNYYNNKTVDVMLDLETFGNKHNPVLIQIAAVAFDLETGEIFQEFNTLVSPQSCVQAGLTCNGDTIEWWLKQDEKVVKKVFVEAITSDKALPEALKDFSAFVENLKKTQNARDVLIWGNGMLADNRWILAAFDACGLKAPWMYWHDQDVRTLVSIGRRLVGFDPKKEMPFDGEPHNAIDDCKHQIKYCSAIFKKLKIPRPQSGDKS
jgi:hypothetical protein